MRATFSDPTEHRGEKGGERRTEGLGRPFKVAPAPVPAPASINLLEKMDYIRSPPRGLRYLTGGHGRSVNGGGSRPKRAFQAFHNDEGTRQQHRLRTLYHLHLIHGASSCAFHANRIPDTISVRSIFPNRDKKSQPFQHPGFFHYLHDKKFTISTFTAFQSLMVCLCIKF